MLGNFTTKIVRGPKATRIELRPQSNSYIVTVSWGKRWCGRQPMWETPVVSITTGAGRLWLYPQELRAIQTAVDSVLLDENEILER